jgi:MFS transporter, MHS family, proline/betaine transporter
MSSTSVTVDTLLRPNSVRAIIAACIGNTLEWYDFIVYTIFAVQISHAFFPSKDAFTSLMAALITFGVGFFARPFGVALLGAYADKAGRKTALTLTVLLMHAGLL